MSKLTTCHWRYHITAEGYGLLDTEQTKEEAFAVALAWARSADFKGVEVFVYDSMHHEGAAYSWRWRDGKFLGEAPTADATLGKP